MSLIFFCGTHLHDIWNVVVKRLANQLRTLHASRCHRHYLHLFNHFKLLVNNISNSWLSSYNLQQTFQGLKLQVYLFALRSWKSRLVFEEYDRIRDVVFLDSIFIPKNPQLNWISRLEYFKIYLRPNISSVIALQARFTKMHSASLYHSLTLYSWLSRVFMQKENPLV